MRLKRLFWARGKLEGFIVLLISCLITSCSSNKIALPIPGQNEAVQKNIYIEYMNIADTYFELQKYDKAENYYKAAMSNKDIYWTAFYKLAKCYVYQNKWALAQDAYENFLKRDENNNSLKASLAYIYAANGNISKSKEAYLELIEENPQQADYLENYISILIAMENMEEAKIYYEKLKEEFPSSSKIEDFKKKFESPESSEEEGKSNN